MASPALQTLAQSASTNSAPLLQHLEALLDYLTSADYAAESLEEASKKVKLCSSRAKKSGPAAGRKERPDLQARADLLGFRLASPAADLRIRVFSQEARYLGWAGVSFGDQAALLITQSLRRLAEATGASSLRFWGRYACREADYFVAQGTVEDRAKDPVPAGAEKPGEGVNEYTFWVANSRKLLAYSALDHWQELPRVTPQQVRAARRLKALLTGRLGSEVKGHPQFPGLEKHYVTPD